jgi:hypothetical protein
MRKRDERTLLLSNPSADEADQVVFTYVCHVFIFGLHLSCHPVFSLDSSVLQMIDRRHDHLCTHSRFIVDGCMPNEDFTLRLTVILRVEVKTKRNPITPH